MQEQMNNTIRKRKGQASIILILLLAVGLIFYAISLNWGRVSQHKMRTTVGANTAVSLMASGFASYSRQLSMEWLNGGTKKCENTNILSLIIGLILIIVIVVLAIFCAPCAAALAVVAIPATVAATLAVLAVAAQLAAVLIHAFVIDPRITELWNSMQQDLPIEEQILERGVFTGMQAGQTDTIGLADERDLNQNGRWFIPGSLTFSNIDRGNSDDEVSRFAFHYTNRQEQIYHPNLSVVEDFQEGLNDYLTAASPGSCPIIDPVDCSVDTSHACCVDANNDGILDYDAIPAVCNPCCLPTSGRGALLRPFDCPAGVPAICSNGPYGANYVYAYDFWYQNDQNTEQSCIELLGLDDFHREFRFDPSITPRDASAPQIQDTSEFIAKDASNIHQLLWQFDDGAVSLSDINAFQMAQNPSHCNFCDDSFSACSTLTVPDTLPNHLSRFDLPGTSTCLGEGCCINKHARDSSGALHHQSTDSIQPLADVIIPDNDCAENHPNLDLLWKKGTDFYCSQGQHPDDWPYFENCADLSCAEDPIDPIDVLLAEVAELQIFNGVFQEQSPSELERLIQAWYPSIAPIIDENFDHDGDGTPDNTSSLKRWVEISTKLRDRLQAWLDTNHKANDAWCIPNNVNEMPQHERDFISTNVPANVPASTPTDLQEIVSCLEFNESNHQKFDDCLTVCNNIATSVPVPQADYQLCENLPRSLMTGFNPSGEWDADKAIFGGSDGVCSAGNPFIAKLQESRDLAVNQSAKMTYRRSYIENIITQVDQAVNTLNQIITRTNDFRQSSAVNNFIDAVRNPNTTGSAPVSLEHFAIYAWQSEQPDNRDKGYWHIVRSEAMVPRRCPTGQCNNTIPWIHTYTAGGFWFIKTKRCYELTAYTGQVQSKVTRYDEDRDDSTTVRFTTNLPIWKFIFHNPEPGRGEADASVVNSLNDCDAIFDPREDGAFMINEPPDPTKLGTNFSMGEACWNKVNELLNSGVYSISCGNYTWEAGMPSIEFAPCTTSVSRATRLEGNFCKWGTILRDGTCSCTSKDCTP